ncbi:MAG: NAD+ synthase [Candidatus Omnitrophota bacterium]
MKITIAQLDPTIGDIEGSLERIYGVLSRSEESPDLVVFPEMFLTGYPPRDLLEKSEFIERVQSAIRDVLSVSLKYPETGILFGAPIPTGKSSGRGLYNSAVLVYRGKIHGVQHKSLLPAYDVFDETRYFDPSPESVVIPFKGHRLGVSVCEDMWNEPGIWGGRGYHYDPIQQLAREGATVFINLSASPFCAGKEKVRHRLIRGHAERYGVPFIFVNQVGGNDDLIFDGRSMFVDGKGNAVSVFPGFSEHVGTVDVDAAGEPGPYVPQDEIGSVYDALVLGIKDYMRKCGFSGIVIGLSGGIDSAVTCVLAKEAAGGANVLGISMPSPYSSGESVEYSRILAGNLGIGFKVIPISQTYKSYIKTLEKEMNAGEDDKEVGVYLQNIQARIRGNILMAFSNKLGYMLLSTGNKSELAVGYCTLYGDMAGGLAAISDVPKTMVYRLAEYMNRESEVIPRAIIIRPPSAELKPGQLDQDTLPPYDILDSILYHYLEEGLSAGRLVEIGFKYDDVEWVIRNVNSNEYKRRQAAPGLKVTTKAFGSGRRMPIAARHE